MKHFKTSKFLAAVCGGMLLVAMALPGTALAHERRTIGNGKYDVVVGWSGEPAYVGQRNAATIRIMNAGSTTPVTGADKTLKLAMRQGASTQTFPLKAVSGQDGFYSADVVPTRVGDYQWMFSGTIGDDNINETFDTADGKFNGVEPAAALEFPVQLGDPAQNVAAAQNAQADAQSARTLGVVGIGVGIVGLLVGLVAIGMAMRRTREPASVGASASTRPIGERA